MSKCQIHGNEARELVINDVEKQESHAILFITTYRGETHEF